MSTNIWYRRPKGAVHDLRAILSLSDVPTEVLYVSERTLALIQNFAAVDILNRSRYASSLCDGYYQTPDEGEADWDAVTDLVRAFQIETYGDTQAIVDVLEAIHVALEELAYRWLSSQ